MAIQDFEDKKILILGFGREGMDTFLFFRKIFPKKIIGIADKEKNIVLPKDKNFKLHLGKNYLNAIKDYDIAVKSPGIPIHLPKIESAAKAGKITSATEIFFNNCQAKIIGVTGSKGKSTTSSLIYNMLAEAGYRALLVGNIGAGALQCLLQAEKNKIDFFVYEVSSHQLYKLKKSPHIAVLLNIFPEHLDYFKSFKEYKQAKANIVKSQTKKDYLIFNGKDKIVKEIIQHSKAQKIDFSSKKAKAQSLLGEHNMMNAAAAAATAELLKIPKSKIKNALDEFKPIGDRLERVGQYQGITFYNDSASTTPESAIAAILALGQELETIILGGSDKRADFKELAKTILKNKIKNIILFPVTGKEIWREIKKAGAKNLPNYFAVKIMKQAVQLCFENTKKGKICVLSPASASFTSFKDYSERGSFFKKYITEYAKYANKKTSA